jgi:hypothetical protein
MLMVLTYWVEGYMLLEKKQYLLMSSDQNEGRCHYVKILITVPLKGWKS